MNKHATWFRRVLWVSIIFDAVLALMTIFFPNSTLRMLGQRPSDDIFWTAFAGMELLLMVLLMVPAARDPYRYRKTAINTVIARFGLAFFFLLLWPGRYPLFGFIDLFWFVVLAPLLYLALRGPQPEWQPSVS